jgi:hypothetical protein
MISAVISHAINTLFIYYSILGTKNSNVDIILWYYCAVTGESKKIVFTSGATEKITSGGATSDFWSPHK